MSKHRVEIDMPFQPMTGDGWAHDIDRELECLAGFYHEDYVIERGERAHLTHDDFYGRVINNHDLERSHVRLAHEEIAALGGAVTKYLRADCDLQFQALQPDASRSAWRILASLRPSPLLDLTIEEAHPNPREAFKNLAGLLNAAGFDDEEHPGSYLTCSEVFSAASAGVNYDRFFADIERMALAADGIAYDMSA